MTRSFSELEPAEAEAVFARFVDERPQALARLRDRLVADGQRVDAVLDGSVESLVPLWAWAKGELRRREDDGWESEAEPFEGQPAPEWYRHEAREERLLSLDAVHLLDGVVSYVGDVVMGAVSGVAWRRGHDRVRSYVDQNRPVLQRGDVAVAVGRMVFGNARSHLFEPGSSPDDQPRTRVERWIDELRRAGAPEEEAEPPLAAVLEEQVVVDRGEEADEWVVEFGDDVRASVGQPALDRLADALPGNAGVRTATFEDREVLVVSGTVDPVALKRSVVAELTRATAVDR